MPNKKRFTATWMVAAEDLAEAVTELCDQSAVISWGQHEEDQQDGFELFDGVLTISAAPGDLCYSVIQFQTTEEDVKSTAWMSPMDLMGLGARSYAIEEA